MPANKMPEMPFSPYLISEWVGPEMTDRRVRSAYTADQMRAMYLAGLEAAKACVPDKWPDEANHDRWVMKESFNKCRDQTLTNLTALEQEAKK